MTTLAHSFRYFVLMLALQLSGHACDAADVCACSPTSYTFKYISFSFATCPTSMNPPSGSGIVNTTCVGNIDTFSVIFPFAQVTVTEVSTQGSSITKQFLADLLSFSFNSAVNASFIPQRLELRTPTTDFDGNLIESNITISYTNNCTEEPALTVNQEIGFYRLVRNSLLFSLFSCVILLSLVPHY
jgi:hypothetical protein